MIKGEIKHIQSDSEFWTDEKCYIIEMSNSEHDPELSIARARVEPDVTTNWHMLNGITERYVILEGQGIVEIADLPPEPVVPGSTVIIPADERQRITNTGSVDLIFLAICTPRFRPEAYLDLNNG